MAMGAVWLIASSASAGTLAVNSKTVALETLGTERNIALDDATGGANGVVFTLGQPLSAGNLIKLSWSSGLAFGGGTYSLCARNGSGNNIAFDWHTPSANATQYTFCACGLPEDANTAAGDVIWLAQGTGDQSCNNAPLVRVLSANAGAGIKTLTMNLITAGGIQVDGPSTAAAVNVTQVL